MAEQKVEEIMRQYPTVDIETIYEEYPELNPANSEFDLNQIDLDEIPVPIIVFIAGGVILTTIVSIILLTIVREKYKKVVGNEDNCLASCCEVAWCTYCIAGQMGK